ncbi:tegument protein pp71 [Aotine betaherpesvirus 1]|uniref:Tegument protein pp71 n=1 Tax=Aotine betaherpesvirus 1 TaxID=50290 RepID=G8XUE8_9BETA|nr:tegument protein pp71 [Aotine betaherpesvirus 1]AEV80778.1 tegument protein pp71 [Aotine betaherpesvirus 1]
MATPGGSPPVRLSHRNYNTLEHFTCQAVRVIFTNPCRLPSNDGKSVNTHLIVRVPKACVLCCFQETSSARETLQLRNLTLKGVCLDRQQTTDTETPSPISIDLYNFSQRPAEKGQPVSFVAFALPLERVSVTGIHLFRARSDENTRTAVTHAKVRVRITRATFHWNIRVVLEDIIWTQRQSPLLPGGQHFITHFYFNTKQLPLTVVDAADIMACSDHNTYIYKAETMGQSPVMKIYLVHLSGHPPRGLFLHFAVYSHQGDVVTRHNPEPFLTRHPFNGFIVHSTQDLTIGALQTAIVRIDNAFETTGRHTTVFFPTETHNGLSMDVGFIPDRAFIQIKIANQTNSEVHIPYMCVLGQLHFFRRGFWSQLPTTTFCQSNQLQLRARVMPRQTAMATGGVSIGTPPEQEEEESTSSEDDEVSIPTPPILSEAVQLFGALGSSSEEEEDPGEGPSSTRMVMTPSSESVVLLVPSLNAFVRIDNLVPLTCSFTPEGIKPTSYLKTEYRDVKAAADLQGTCTDITQPAPAPAASRSPTGRRRPRV